MNGLLKPFTDLLDAVSKHGYIRTIFSLTVLVVLVVTPVYLLLLRRDRVDKEVTELPPVVDVGPEIQERLSNIRRGLGADVVWVGEFFLTETGDERGFSPVGFWEVNYRSRSVGAPRNQEGFTGRFSLRPSPSDPTGYIASEIERWRRAGFYLLPDTGVIGADLSGMTDLIGRSYYIIGGYDLSGMLVANVQISFFREQIMLTVEDLRAFVSEVQTITFLLLGTSL